MLLCSAQRRDSFEGKSYVPLKLDEFKTISSKTINFLQVYFLTPIMNDKILIVTSRSNEILSSVISVMNLVTGKPLKTEFIMAGPVTKQSFSKRHNLFFTTSSDNLIKLWRLPGFSECGVLTHAKRVLDFVQIENTDFLATCGFFMGICLWNIRSNTHIDTIRNKEETTYDKLSYVEKYDWLIAVDNNVVHLFDWRLKQEKYMLMAHRVLPVLLIEFYPSLNSFILVHRNCESHKIHFHGEQGFESVWKIEDQYGFVKEAFLLGNRFLIMILFNKPAQVFDVLDGKKVGVLPIYHNERFASLQKKHVLLIYNFQARRIRFFSRKKQKVRNRIFRASNNILNSDNCLLV